MTVWDYRDSDYEGPRDFIQSCRYCSTGMRVLASDEDADGIGGTCSSEAVACDCCGWWSIFHRQTMAAVMPTEDDDQRVIWCKEISAAAGSLRQLDLSDITTPIQEVRSFLMARFESRFSLHPRLFEETVGSVFRDLGYEVEVTACTKDGGVDVFLNRGTGQSVGIQVKNTRDNVGVEQIRALAGALIINDCTRGVFVATKGYTYPSKMAANELMSRGYPVELMEPERFYEQMGIAQLRTRPIEHDLTRYSRMMKSVESITRSSDDPWE